MEPESVMTDKMRSEFEKWALSNDGPSVSVMRNEVGRYEDEELNMAWLGWQAARTVPEGYVMVPVDLLDRFPELNEFNYSHDDVCELNAWGIDLVLSAALEVKK